MLTVLVRMLLPFNMPAHLALENWIPRANVQLTLGNLGTTKGLFDDDVVTCMDVISQRYIQAARVTYPWD
jgi:hypothetical protein